MLTFCMQLAWVNALFEMEEGQPQSGDDSPIDTVGLLDDFDHEN
jgi:hypothetical protein